MIPVFSIPFFILIEISASSNERRVAEVFCSNNPGTCGPQKGGVVSDGEDCCSGGEGGESGGSKLVSTTAGNVTSPSDLLLLSAVDAVVLVFGDGCFNHFRISMIIHRSVSLLWKHFGNDARAAEQVTCT